MRLRISMWRVGNLANETFTYIKTLCSNGPRYIFERLFILQDFVDPNIDLKLEHMYRIKREEGACLSQMCK